MYINKYRNFINKLIAWEWMILKQLRKSKRRIILLRESFAILSLLSILFSVFGITFVMSNLIIAIGFPNSSWSNSNNFFSLFGFGSFHQ